MIDEHAHKSVSVHVAAWIADLYNFVVKSVYGTFYVCCFKPLHFYKHLHVRQTEWLICIQLHDTCTCIRV